MPDSPNHPDAGAAAYEEAVAALRTSGPPLKLAHTVRHLADIYRRAGDQGRAERCYDESLDLYRSHPEARPLDFANALRGAALLQELIGKPQQAAQLWRQAEALYRETNVDAGVEEATRHLARLGVTTSAASP
ncbi:MAG TPA: tetratricopeptide repeat protein [Thermoanaerobaculia bacterium]|nr:tetratricopeptide repeat protein [Thermoanaerobaculia bacterium]